MTSNPVSSSSIVGDSCCYCSSSTSSTPAETVLNKPMNSINNHASLTDITLETPTVGTFKDILPAANVAKVHHHPRPHHHHHHQSSSSPKLHVCKHPPLHQHHRRLSNSAADNVYTIPSSLPQENWSCDTEKFKLRSKTYLRDKKKAVCDTTLFDLIGMDLLEVDSHAPDVAKTLKGGAADVFLSQPGPKPFLFIVHFQLPGEKNLAFIAYFAAKAGVLDADTNSSRLFKDFINGTDDYRQSRFKFIPLVSKGPFLVRSMVGSTPAILGTKLTQTYHSGEGYFEVCVDVGSSTVGGSLLKLVKGYLTTLTFDMCFLLEAQAENELPEVSLGTLRFANLDLKMAQKFVPKS